ncbi:carboxylate--amine ligase [Candidatus Saccharibacteria bacterium]|nr:carboxylate--amine ligase [Candidatus Saccharibacteria bacterium]
MSKISDFKVVLLGTDINAYYMSRNFHEAFGIKCHLIGRVAMPFTKLSSILTYEIDSQLLVGDRLNRRLKEIARQNEGRKIILVGTNDDYVQWIIKNADSLQKDFLFNYSDRKMVESLMDKKKFYTKYSDSDLIKLPRTYFYDVQKNAIDWSKVEELAFPVIIKPSNTVSWHEHPFSGQAKVYKLYDRSEVKKVIENVADSGYDSELIIQEFIPGGDDRLFDVVFYCDTSGKPRLMSFAQIGLQERTPTGIGNATVLVNGFNEFGGTEVIKNNLIKFMRKLNYKGMAEFDLKYDERDQTFKVLEINPRQARCSYYLTVCGYNLAKYLADDLLGCGLPEFTFIDQRVALSFVPNYVIKKYIKNVPLKREIAKLRQQKKLVDPLVYPVDMSLQRRLWLFIRKFNYMSKYRKNVF